MTHISLPKVNQTGANEWADVQDNDEAIARVVNGELDNDNIKVGAEISRSKLEPAAAPVVWYPPCFNSGSGTRASETLGPLNDKADRIDNIRVGSGQIIMWSFIGMYGLTSPTGAGAYIWPILNGGAINSYRGNASVIRAAWWQENPTLIFRTDSTQAGGIEYNTPQGTYTTPLQMGPFMPLFVQPGEYSLEVAYMTIGGRVLTGYSRALWAYTIG